MSLTSKMRMRKLKLQLRHSENGAKVHPLLTTRDVAQIARVTTRTVKNWIASGKLPVIRLGRNVRIDPNDLQKYINENRGNKVK